MDEAVAAARVQAEEVIGKILGDKAFRQEYYRQSELARGRRVNAADIEQELRNIKVDPKVLPQQLQPLDPDAALSPRSRAQAILDRIVKETQSEFKTDTPADTEPEPSPAAASAIAAAEEEEAAEQLQPAEPAKKEKKPRYGDGQPCSPCSRRAFDPSAHPAGRRRRPRPNPQPSRRRPPRRRLLLLLLPRPSASPPSPPWRCRWPSPSSSCSCPSSSCPLTCSRGEGPPGWIRSSLLCWRMIDPGCPARLWPDSRRFRLQERAAA